MVVSGFAKTLLSLHPCAYLAVTLCDGSGAGVCTMRRKSKGHLLPRTQLKCLCDLFSECRNFAPEAAAGRLAVPTAPKEGSEDPRNHPVSCHRQQEMPGRRVPKSTKTRTVLSTGGQASAVTQGKLQGVGAKLPSRGTALPCFLSTALISFLTPLNFWFSYGKDNVFHHIIMHCVGKGLPLSSWHSK